jgi:hypothetical protein
MPAKHSFCHPGNVNQALLSEVVFQVFHSGHFALTMYRKKHPQNGELPSSILNHHELGCVSMVFIYKEDSPAITKSGLDLIHDVFFFFLTVGP